jgi:hypothetical protein
MGWARKRSGRRLSQCLRQNTHWNRLGGHREYEDNPRAITSLVLGILTVWRITHFLRAEDGPMDIVVLMRRSAGESVWGKLLDCFYCLSVWVSLPFGILLGGSWLERALLWPSLSAGAIILERVTNFGPSIPRAPFTEDPDEEN